jgi:hypothetical protein
MDDRLMQPGPGLNAMLVQLGPVVQGILRKIQPLVDQPVIRFPYVMDGSQVIAAGASGTILNSTLFGNNLEWPFEVHSVKFSQDAAHTYFDWKVYVQDQTFNQPFGKQSARVSGLVDENTGKWALEMPWVVRPKGGGLSVAVDNLDATNPITVDVSFIGYLLIPR